jgi:hypothetical protein
VLAREVAAEEAGVAAAEEEGAGRVAEPLRRRVLRAAPPRDYNRVGFELYAPLSTRGWDGTGIESGSNPGQFFKPGTVGTRALSSRAGLLAIAGSARGLEARHLGGREAAGGVERA